MALFTGTNIRIELQTGVTLTGGTAVIRFKRPGGTTGTWTGVIDGSTVYYDTLTADINQAGDWQFQVVAQITGKTYKSDITRLTFSTPIKVS
jgi:hypothetical protein